MTINCIVVDDEPAMIDLLSFYIKQNPSLNLVNATTRPMEAVEWVNTKQIDLVFLDVEMTECSGIEFISRVKGKCHIILCTGYPQYALDGFEHDVIDFLLKPVSQERFTRAVEKAGKIISTRNTPGENDYLFIIGETRFQKIKIPFADIDYLRSLRNYTAFYCGRKKMVSRINLGEVEKQLPRNRFLRVHMSYIVPIARIKSFNNRAILLQDIDQSIPIGSTYRDLVLDVLKDHASAG